jgi:hypothetical protein
MSLIIHYQPHNDFGEVKLRVRDWYVLSPFTAFVHVTSNRLLERHKTIVHKQTKYKIHNWKTNVPDLVQAFPMEKVG